jgi:hypothetical protein
VSGCPDLPTKLVLDQPPTRATLGGGMNTLTFKYPLRFTVLVFLGIPLLAIMGPGMIILSVYVIADASAPVGLRIQTILMIPLGVLFSVIPVMAARTWYSVLSEYSVSQAGIKITFFSAVVFLYWRDLEGGRYRKAFGQLELRFRSYPRLVVLSNVDMNWERGTVLAALQLAETAAHTPLKRTVF